MSDKSTKLESVDLNYLVNKEFNLDAIGTSILRTQDRWNELHDASCLNFRLDGIIYTCIEDPSDGYRSSLDSIIVNHPDAKLETAFYPVKVKSRWVNSSNDGGDLVCFIDIESNKVVLTIGTDNIDDYYPCCILNWVPENLSENQFHAPEKEPLKRQIPQPVKGFIKRTIIH